MRIPNLLFPFTDINRRETYIIDMFNLYRHSVNGYLNFPTHEFIAADERTMSSTINLSGWDHVPLVVSLHYRNDYPFA